MPRSLALLPLFLASAAALTCTASDALGFDFSGSTIDATEDGDNLQSSDYTTCVSAERERAQSVPRCGAGSADFAAGRDEKGPPWRRGLAGRVACETCELDAKGQPVALRDWASSCAGGAGLRAETVLGRMKCASVRPSGPIHRFATSGGCPVVDARRTPY